MKTEFKVFSSDKVHQLAGVVYLPEGEAKGFFHIVHGMTEHIGRYDRIMADLAENGYICFGYDNLGHGYTANDKNELGYIAKKRGWELLCRDVKMFSDAVIEFYGKNYENKLPYILMGHSMGSFIVRLSTEKFVKPDKLIVMGTGGPNPAAGAGIMLTELVKLFCGEKYISKFIENLAMGNYNTKFKKMGDDNSGAWLSTDLSIREKYRGDDFCTFKFTVSAMGDLMRLLKYSNRGAWFKNVANVPILLVSGSDDPVGSFGKGVKVVENKLKKAGKSVKCKLYQGARHEILNDFTYEEVKIDILDFAND